MNVLWGASFKFHTNVLLWVKLRSKQVSTLFFQKKYFLKLWRKIQEGPPKISLNGRLPSGKILGFWSP